MINAERLAQIEALHLSPGSHVEFEHGMCVMEAVSYVAGEPWSDAPQCACPVLTAFLVSWNDSLPDDASRDRLLKPLVPLLVGTRSTPAVEQRRAAMAADWLIRVHTPAWLRLAQLHTQAAALEALPEITEFTQRSALMGTLSAVRKDAARDADRAAAGTAARAAAWDAARAAAGTAARAAAGTAARAAAGTAARAAAGAAARAAARDAVWVAARAAAWDAAWVAAWDAAAGAALTATTEALQASAVDLVRRMIAVQA